MTTQIIPLRSQIILPSDQQTRPGDPWVECVLRWLEAVENRRGSARSRQEYQKILTAFFHFVGKEPQTVAGADVQGWVSDLKRSGLANSTIKTRLAAVSSFYQFACARYEVEPGRYLHDFNPTTTAQRPHVNPYEKSQGLSADEVRQLLRVCDRQTIRGRRDFALIATYVYTGRRCSEIARLKWADLRPGTTKGSREYHYIGKGGKARWRDLPPPAWSAIEEYLRGDNDRLDRMQLADPIFLPTGPNAGDGSRPITDRAIRQLLDGAAHRAGLGHVKVHALRHTAAKLRRKTGATVEEVSEYLDHTSLAVTQVYLGATEAKTDNGWQKIEALIDF